MDLILLWFATENWNQFLTRLFNFSLKYLGYPHHLNLLIVNFILQLAILEAEQKAEEEQGIEISSKKRGKKGKNLTIK